MHGAPADSIVHPRDAIDLRATYGDFDVGPDHCGGFWYVNRIELGNAEVGTIDTCGHYQAPAAFVAGLEVVMIEVSDWDMRGGCADCCPYAMVQLEVR